MLGAEVLFGAFAPGTDEVVVEACPDHGTEYGDDSSGPLLDNFRTGRYSDPLDDARNKLVDEFLFDEFAPDVNSGGAGGCDPQFGNLFVAIEFEAVDEAEFLNR